MRINNNIPAMNAHRLLNNNGLKSAKNLERLSSGKRINRAGDDAAGMAISEKMRAQVRGLKMASRNSLDGVSLVQTAEGAMNEVHSMLQRMRELSVQAANGTSQDEDRQAIQDEINQLTSEVNRIANGTEYNTRNILKGNEGPDSNTVVQTMSTGKPAQLLGATNLRNLDNGSGKFDFKSEQLSIWIDDEEKVVNLTQTNSETTLDNFMELINDALGKSANATLTKDGQMEITTNSIGGLSSIELKGSNKVIDIFGNYAYRTIEFSNEIISINSGLEGLNELINYSGEKFRFYAGISNTKGEIAVYGSYDGMLNNNADKLEIRYTASMSGVESWGYSIDGRSTWNEVDVSDGFINIGGISIDVSEIRTDSGLNGAGSWRFDVKIKDVMPVNVSGDISVNGVYEGPFETNEQTRILLEYSHDEVSPSWRYTTSRGVQWSSWSSLDPSNNLVEIEGLSVDISNVTLGNSNGDIGVWQIDVSQSQADSSQIKATGIAENATRISEGTFLFTDIPEIGSTVKVGNEIIEFFDSSASPYIGSNRPIDLNGMTSAEDVVGEIVNKFGGGGIGGVSLSADPVFIGVDNPARLIITANEVGFGGNLIYLEGTPDDFTTNLQVGSNTGQGFRLQIGDLRAQNLKISADNPTRNPGVKGASYVKVASVTDGISSSMTEYAIDVSTEERASAAISVFNNAIVEVASQRSKLGATQNRLEHTIANLDNTAENLTAAMSRIEDTDMALEMSEFQKMNILQQAGMSMLTQANQQPQAVLQLLN